MNGRVGSLLEVGTGFHQELTGRENIYLSGTILGMRRGEIDRMFDEIVDFSGVEKFIDMPIKRYSSGMKVRLGFAVAAHLQPEILLVDEVLAVGDRNFHEKALGKMKNVVGAGRTVLFVSHYMTAIAQLCERVILMEHGHITMDGPANVAIGRYLGLDATGANRSNDLADYRRSSPDEDPRQTKIPDRGGEGAFGSGDLHFFDSISICGQPMPGALVLSARPQFVAEIEGDTRSRIISDLRIELHFSTEEGVRVLSTATTWSPLGHFDAQGPLRLRCEIDRLALLPGRYLVTIEASSGKQSLEALENVGIVTIVPPRNQNVESIPKQKRDGYFWVDSRWSIGETA
jgi:energy-coupling factor transporter ATP-binding protein EcfA2